MSEPTIETGRRVLALEAKAIEALAAALDENFSRAVEAILAAKGRVICAGIGKSGHVARKIAATFASTGTPSHFVHAAEASHGDLGMIASGDVMLALSKSGETPELSDLVTYAKRFGVVLVAMTSDANSVLARAADIRLILPDAREACAETNAPTTSTTLMMAYGDALAVALLERRGFRADDFRLFHPRGKLGAMLKLVRDIMRSGDAMPVVPVGTRMSEALVEMTAKSLGCVLITNSDGHLQGIITDGDLRRHMQPDLPQTEVERIMTRAPMTVAPDMLASEALEILNSSKKTQLIVVPDDKPVGVVPGHDLLRAGVA